MANSGWGGKLSERFSAAGCFGENSRKEAVVDFGAVENVCVNTSVAEQVRMGGLTRLDRPVTNDGDQPTQPRPARFQGGSADSASRGGFNVAAYIGKPPPQAV